MADDDNEPDLFAGRSHAEVLDLTFDGEPSDLIDGLVPRGVVVTTAGLPETYKGWVCAKKAAIIAAGEGELLGCEAVAQGPVGYFWQDDSTRNEAERVQLYAHAHNTPRDLPVRWFLNEDLRLPAGMDKLRATIEHYGFVYVVLDSFYNIAADVDLKDRDAGSVFAKIKTDICDPTGCTVDVVDHMPWATDTNRKRLRGYGDVFKNAAVRAGLYIDADGNKLYVEARGNNIRGFKRTAAYWDADRLELLLVEAAQADHEALDAATLDYVSSHPGDPEKDIEAGVEGGRESIRKSLERLATLGHIARGPGRHPRGKYWFPANHAALHSPDAPEATPGDTLFGTVENGHSPVSPIPRRGGDMSGESFEELVAGFA